MRNASNGSVGGIINASWNATPLMKTKTISTSCLKKRSDGSGLADMDVTIYGANSTGTVESRGDDNSEGTSISFVATMPQTWSPSFYLVMVNASI